MIYEAYKYGVCSMACDKMHVVGILGARHQDRHLELVFTAFARGETLHRYCMLDFETIFLLSLTCSICVSMEASTSGLHVFHHTTYYLSIVCSDLLTLRVLPVNKKT